MMANSWAVEQVLRIAEELRIRAGEVQAASGELVTLAEKLREDLGGGAWAFPVGTEQYPPEHWYASQLHRPGVHTGIDLNLDQWPWGDVDRGAPVFAVADGVVHSRGSNAAWLGVVVVRVARGEGWLYVRYGHLHDDIPVQVGQEVVAGQVLGYLGDYQRGDTGDHLHFDMATSWFDWNWWLTETVDWVNPVPVLEAHLDADRVKAMLRRGA